MPHKIQEMTAADYDAVMGLWNSCAGVRATESREEIVRILGRNPGLSCVVRDEGQLIGAVLCCHDGRRGYLYHLGVAESHRKQGIGRAVVERCLALLQTERIARCTLFVVSNNDSGMDFWKRLGWRERTDLKAMAIDLA